jgi:hypothetical protein
MLLLIFQREYCLITAVYTKMGKKAYGVSAGDGEVHFTVRSDSNSQMKVLESSRETGAQSIARNTN